MVRELAQDPAEVAEALNGKTLLDEGIHDGIRQACSRWLRARSLPVIPLTSGLVIPNRNHTEDSCIDTLPHIT